MDTFGERLKQYRQTKGLTQQELADRLGVSNKTVSRWENEGGYPDVPLLAPLARALGVTIDDLLDEKRPIRTLGREDWQSLLSFAFALGGGVAFFLLDLFMPSLLCYLAYLGCLAYGVYLQRYYAAHSRWFFLGETVVNLAINLTMALNITAGIAALGSLSGGEASLFWLMRQGAWDVLVIALIIAGVVGVALTVVTQILILRWSRGGPAPMPTFKLERAPLSVRPLLPLLIPLVSGLFWVLYYNDSMPVWVYRHQLAMFLGLLGAGVLLCLILFCKKGRRGRLVPSLLLTALCGCQLPLAAHYYQFVVRGGGFVPYDWRRPEAYYIAFFQSSDGMVVFTLVIALVYLACALVRVRRVSPS